ncbi:hypothetical protein BDZ94DRAFT_1266571 [Collybia nuda]|uniref:Uncharacterized protein n=1 Tax=Collybia nuda TaxID=64659 RepID=A0A9P5Y0P3_9AGAR|nr:hypothetical protein BDZ94DRAFT_1266571 [Collybia nuda]
MRSSILNILRDCPIVSVNVSNIVDFPLLNLKYCPNLKHLAFEIPSTLGAIPSLHELDYSEDRVELENLKISASSRLSRIPINVFTHPRSPLSISRLVCLGACIRSLEDHDTCQLFIDNSRNTLRKFELWIFGPDHFHMLVPTSPTSINLNSCSQLQCLSFHVPRSVVAPFLWLRDLFETIPNDNCLEEISLSLSEAPSTGWQALDLTLSGPKFGGLKAIILPVLPLRPKRKIPLLLSKGIIRVSRKEFKY